MKVRLKCILTFYISYFGLITVQTRMADQVYDLFDSIAKNDAENSNFHHQALKREVAGEQQAFDTMKRELDNAYVRNFVKKTKVIKRELAPEDILAESSPYENWDTMKNFSGPPKRPRTKLIEDVENHLDLLLTRGIKIAKEALEECHKILNGTFDYEQKSPLQTKSKNYKDPKKLTQEKPVPQYGNKNPSQAKSDKKYTDESELWKNYKKKSKKDKKKYKLK